jgi:hypothetical protein
VEVNSFPLPQPAPPRRFTLTLSQAEAEALVAIVGYVTAENVRLYYEHRSPCLTAKSTNVPSQTVIGKTIDDLWVRLSNEINNTL